MNATTPLPPVKTGTPPMLTVARLARILVGLLFIVSGLIKMNDPIGTQIKMTEYFEVFAADLPALAETMLADGKAIDDVPFPTPPS